MTRIYAREVSAVNVHYQWPYLKHFSAREDRDSNLGDNL